MTELQPLFVELRATHFPGGLPDARVEWSTRLRRAAGICYPERRLIRLSTLYFGDHPDDLVPILLHEMVHLIHPRHDAAFRAEAARVGAMRYARPGRDRPWRWLAYCPRCAAASPYRVRARLWCGRCPDTRLVFHALPGTPGTREELARSMASLRARLAAGTPERRRPPASVGGGTQGEAWRRTAGSGSEARAARARSTRRSPR